MGANVYAVIGSDDYIVDVAVRKIVGDCAGLETIDSRTSTAAEAQLSDIGRADSSLMEAPFLYPEKATWWRNVHFLPAAGKKQCSEEVKESLERFAAKLAATNLPDNQKFVLSGPSLLPTSIFAKTLKQGVQMVELDAGRGKRSAAALSREAVVRAVDYAEEMGLKFAHGAADAFVAVTGPDARSQVNELRKLDLYLGPGRREISLSDVQAVTSPGAGAESAIWSVTDAIARRDVAAAMEAMRDFEGESGFAVMMASTVERCFRQLAVVKDAQMRDAGCPPSLSPWQFDKLCAAARRWSLQELRRARHRMAALREDVVSGAGDAVSRIGIEIARACTRR